VRWSCTLKGHGLQALLCKLCLAATVYHLWRLRNDLCHRNTPRTKEALVDEIQWELGVDSCLGGRLSGRLCLFVLFRFRSCNLVL